MEFRIKCNAYNTLEEVYINDNEVFCNGEIIETNEEERINMLINLFSFKEKWISEDVANPKYQIYFKDKEKEIFYKFRDELPNNWFVFYACLRRLLGRL